MRPPSTARPTPEPVIAEVEKPDGTYEYVEMGAPECGEDYCDGCGDCLACQSHGDEDWCPGGSRWVIYMDSPKSPYRGWTRVGR